MKFNITTNSTQFYKGYWEDLYCSPYMMKENTNMASVKSIAKKSHWLVYDMYSGCPYLCETEDEANTKAASLNSKRATTAHIDYEIVIYKSLRKVEQEVPAVKFVDYTD